jgi:glycerol transport system ATP-binding protein
MAHIEFKNLAHSYQRGRANDAESVNTWALKPLSMVWNDGGAYALLGPSGCGKTTLLNIVSGLITPSQGQVLFDGRDVTQLAPQARNIAQVFQFPVIYDTMSVSDNLAFPLRNRGWKAADIRKRVHEVADLLELTSDLPLRASGLTPDVKQKISLGRGLVRPDVAAVLFDEPLTVIDPHLKWLLRRKLKQIHQQLKLSLIYVTHDQIEALTFADTVVVMTQGEIAQSGTAQDLFERPAHTFVGHFIGSPGMNFLPCELTDNAAAIGRHLFRVDNNAITEARARGGIYKLGIRPEFIECSNSESAGSHRVTITSVQPMGAYTLIAAQLDTHPLWIKANNTLRLSSDSTWIRVPPERALIYANDRRMG